ncbi:serine protease FAM111A-like [Dromiciops gliroides]|uniref:serine protease FAM111A-like n=1 Tax=Dromiciops gliroides TaxID=33562 RepID=UPI001CC7654D|nr:serine protease FAM111A-like [Dromiciops gliroides]
MMLVHGKMGRENGYVNLGMPLKCVPKDSHFEISFTQSKRHKKHGTEQLRQYDHKGGECIKFYVFAIGKEAKIIVKCPDLRREQYKLCVYAFKGESIEDALNRDGRFLTFPEEWNVIETVHYHLQKTFLVDDLEGREFQVEKHRRVSPRGAASQSCELEQTESDMLKQILDKYPSLRREGEKIRKKFNQEKKEKNISRMSTLFKTHRKNLEQLTQDSVPVEVHKLLGHLSDSVGYMFLKNNGISQGVTCFLLRDHYILTCCHMINLLVGINVESTMWAEAISKQAWVTFADKDIDSDSVKKWSIDPEFGVFNKDLDYAMLRLKKNDIPLPKGLQNKCTSPPLNGLLYIIGYPDKQRKQAAFAIDILPHRNPPSLPFSELVLVLADFCALHCAWKNVAAPHRSGLRDKIIFITTIVFVIFIIIIVLFIFFIISLPSAFL